MFLVARLYPEVSQAKAAAAAFVEAGYLESDVVYLMSPDAAEPAPMAEGEAPTAESVDMSTAVRAGNMLGEHAEFYLSRLTGSRALVVTTPPFIASKKAEEILDSFDPLPDTHRPASEEFVPFTEQATPFSNMLGWPTLTSSETPFSSLLGFGSKQEGFSHLSRGKILAPDFTFSSKLGMGFKARKDTVFGGSTKSNRLEGKNSSFGMGFKTKRDTPFSSLLGLPLLAKRKHFLYS